MWRDTIVSGQPFLSLSLHNRSLPPAGKTPLYVHIRDQPHRPTRFSIMRSAILIFYHIFPISIFSDPWKHTRRLSTCSRTSYVGDKNKPGKSPTESDKIRNVPSFTSYNDSGIDPDSNEYEGSFGYQQAGIMNTTCELDNTPATRHAKKRPRLTQKRISFKDEVELEKLAELALGETEAQKDTVGTSDSQQFSMASSVDVQRNLVITRSDDNYQDNRTERGLKNTSDETHLIAVSMGTESVIQVSSDEKQRGNRDASGK